MLTTAAVPNTTVLPVPATAVGTFKDKIETGMQRIRNFAFGPPVPVVKENKSLKVKEWKVLDYVCDLWVIMDSCLVLAKEYALRVPKIVRMMVAFFGTLNLALVPQMALTTLHSLYQFGRQPPVTATWVIEGVVRIVHLSALTAVFSAISAVGLREYFRALEFSTHDLDRMAGAIFPWVRFALRLSLIPQLMDISIGMQSNGRLSAQLKPFTNTERFYSVVFPTEKQLQLVNGVSQVFALYNPMRQRAKLILEELKTHKRLYSKFVPGSESAREFDSIIAKIETSIHSKWPRESLKGCERALQLGINMKAFCIKHINNQMLGFSGNTCAIVAMVVVANAAAAAIFWILSSFFFMWQTSYSRELLLLEERSMP